MGINIQAKTDYSVLFNSIGSGNSANSLSGINFSDYASIKNGSYGKLLKAYYAKDSNKSEASSKTDKLSDSKDKTSALQKVATTADNLAAAADKLITTGSKSLFKEKDITSTDENGITTTTKGYDMDAIYGAVKNFADSYNSFINKAKKSSDANVARQADNLATQVTMYNAKLNSVGISINDDDTLKIDEETFKKADITTLKGMFNGNQSITYQIAAKTSMIGTAADSEAKAQSGYTNTGDYAKTYSAGSILSDII